MNYILQIVVLLFSVIVHEVAHGYVAYRNGDNTAKIMGRLTLNPISHIDLFGSIILPLMLLLINAPVFGWAKPVPINPLKLNNPKTDMIWVSLAGCAANFALAVISGIGMYLIRTFVTEDASVFISVYNILYLMLIINIILPLFNLVPIPPLDGSRVVFLILPREAAAKYAKIEPYGFLIIFALLATNVLWNIIQPIAAFLINILGGRYF